MQHSLNWQSGHVWIKRQKKITKKYSILSKHNQRRSKTRVLSAFAKATRTAQLPRMKKLSCDQTVPIFYQTVKMLLSSCLMSHSFANTCHKIINITRPKSAYAPGLRRSARKWWFFVSSVRSSNSHPDLLVTQHHPHFFRSHRSSTLDFHFLSHYSYIKAIMLYKGNH